MRVCVAFLLSFLFILFPALSIAVDELYLTGKVINYEPDTGKIKIDVLSTSCKGVREFWAEKGFSKDLLINKVISFGIDSNHCDKFKIHKIRTPLLN
ncbi:hypothetical protein [Thermodesulfovibrio yellowstonii]|uniref:hypothetical protein n=1 Tax=Thermodesulfovibrio yellowstonii TaxID=28262 RepID=UPI0024B3AF2D|nr:hypothetical protein [Thermodesulfovibrio yellowstonii]MDI6864305.1 hypothetical protein [Thermodesulfovibrio yellowstonii]